MNPTDQAEPDAKTSGHLDQVQFLYRRLPIAVLASGLVALVLAAGQIDTVRPDVVAAWLAIFGLVALGRVGSGFLYKRHHASAEQAPLWLRRFRIGALIAGLSWALGAYLLFPGGNIEHQAFVAFAVAGVTAGAASSMAPDRPSFLSFAGPPLATLIALFLRESGVLAGSMGVMLVFYSAFLALGAAQSRAWLHDLAQLKGEAAIRAERLAASEERLRRLNAELESRVGERTAALAESERFNHGVIDSLSAQLAVLDATGLIVASNAAWRRNSATTDHDWLAVDIGANYLAACDNSLSPQSAHAKAMAAGIRDVIERRRESFRYEYDAASDRGAIWYTLHATTFASGGSQRVVITHIDSTAVHEAMGKASASERVLTSLARVSPVGFFRAKADGTCEYVNHRWCEIAGLSETEALDHGYLQTVHPDDRARVHNEWLAATRAGEPFRSEFRFQRSDGSISWVLAQAVAIIEADHAVTSYIGTLTDISDGKQIEIAMQALSTDLINLEGTAYLEAAALRLTILLDMEFCAISQYDPLQANPVRTMTLVEDGVIRPTSKAQVAGSPGSSVASGKSLVVERGAQTMFPNAQLIQAHGIDSYIGEPLFDPAGKCIGHVAVMSRRPIREVKTVTTILRMFAVAISAAIVRDRNRRQYADLFQFAPDGLMMVDQQGRIALANLRAEEIFGWSRDEMVGQPIEMLIPVESHTRHRQHRIMYQGAPGPRQMGAGQMDVRGLRKDGSDFPAEVHLAPVASDRGVVIAAAVRDVTARKALEAQLAQAGRLEAIGRITGGLAHDFNNYLGIIIGHLDLLQEISGTDPRAGKHVAAALSGALRSAELTQSLLAYSRKQPLTPRLTDISQRVTSLIPLLEHTLGKEVVLTTRIAPDLWPVKVDGAQLDSCLVNLATNARDAMPEGGLLTIAVRNMTLDAADCAETPDARPGDHVLIEVADTGQGMPPEILAQAFEPFFTTKGPGHGTGLGLSMVYGFVRQSGGHVRLASVVGQGTRVEIHLPRAEAAKAAAQDETASAILPRGSETILVVEDNTQVLHAAVAQIESLGYRVVGVENAEAALDTLERNADLSLVFTDIIMPGALNGYQLAEQTRQRWPHIKILLTSGFPGDGVNQALGGVTIAPLLRKPYRKDELAQAIRKALDPQAAA